jgi:DNA-binding NtrC family response regulator
MSNVRLLFVEDCDDDVFLASYVLNKAGIQFEARTVEHETELEQTLRDWAPHVVISDFTLPQFSGFGALTCAQKVQPDTPFIFHSAVIGRDRAAEALRRGAYGLVEKGHTDQFVKLVAEALERSHAAGTA